MSDHILSVIASSFRPYVESLHSHLSPLTAEWADVMRKHPVLSKIAIGTTITAVILFLRTRYLEYQQKRLRLPPILYGVPVLGSMFTFMFYQSKFHSQLLPSIGPIVSYTIGSKRFITLNDERLIRAVLKSKLCIDRPAWAKKVFIESGFIPSFSNCNQKEHWEIRRKLMKEAITAMINRNFVQKQIMFLMNNYLYKSIDENKDEWYCNEDLRHAAFNMVYGAIYGDKHQMSKQGNDYQSINSQFHTFFKLFIASSFMQFFPMYGLTKIIFSNIDSKIQESLNQIMGTFEKTNKIVIKSREQRLAKGEVLLFDQLYDKMEKHDIITEDMLLQDIITLFGAAIDTTALVLETALLYSAKYPQLQEKMYDELIRYCKKYEYQTVTIDGDGKKIQQTRMEFDNTKYHNCVYFRAFINESLRIGMPTPASLPRAVTQPCVLAFNTNENGECVTEKDGVKFIERSGVNIKAFEKKYANVYVLDSSMIVEPNLGYIGDHEGEFDINKWLKINEKDGSVKFYKYLKSVPFSLGDRNCVGEDIAMRELYGFLANLFVNYQFCPVKGTNVDDISIKYVQELTKRIQPSIPLRVELRHQ